MEQYLSVKNINKNFGAFQALKNVSFDVKEGEFVAYLVLLDVVKHLS